MDVAAKRAQIGKWMLIGVGVPVGLVVALFLAMVGYFLFTGSDSWQVARTKADVEARLFNGEHAEFADVRTYRSEDQVEVSVCGKVTGTNSFGGYANGLRFVKSGRRDHLMIDMQQPARTPPQIEFEATYFDSCREAG